MLQNVTIDELQIRREVSLIGTRTQQDTVFFATMLGDVNPALMNPDYPKRKVFLDIVGQYCGRRNLPTPPPKLQSWPLQVKLKLL